MSIPISIDPLGRWGDVRWYNWTAAKWSSVWGPTTYSSEYIISDFIPVSPGSITFAGVGSSASGQSPAIMVYNASGSHVDFWNLDSVEQTTKRTVTIVAKGAYVRLQTTRALYRESYVIQNGVYLFKGKDNPPKPLT